MTVISLVNSFVMFSLERNNLLVSRKKVRNIIKFLNTWLKEELYRDEIDVFSQNCKILIAFAMRIHLNMTYKKYFFYLKGNVKVKLKKTPKQNPFTAINLVSKCIRVHLISFWRSTFEMSYVVMTNPSRYTFFLFF